MSIRPRPPAVALSASTLARQNVDPSVLHRQWATEDARRIQRLQKAAKELGIEDMPAQWCRPY
jgi:hypothetical protein